MPKRQQILRLKIMFPEPSVADSSDSDDDGESLKNLMSEFKKQMESLEQASEVITEQVTNLYARAKAETTDWLAEPLIPKPALKDWLVVHELPVRPTLEEFFEVCLDNAKSLDLESRMVVFHRDDAVALWRGKRRMTIFEVLALVPTLFH